MNVKEKEDDKDNAEPKKKGKRGTRVAGTDWWAVVDVELLSSG